jgi:hypothetical protein
MLPGRAKHTPEKKVANTEKAPILRLLGQHEAEEEQVFLVGEMGGM